MKEHNSTEKQKETKTNTGNLVADSKLNKLYWEFGCLICLKCLSRKEIWVFPKIVGKPPKWMVYNGSKPYEQMDDLGGHPYFWKQPNETGKPTFRIQSWLLLILR